MYRWNYLNQIKKITENLEKNDEVLNPFTKTKYNE